MILCPLQIHVQRRLRESLWQTIPTLPIYRRTYSVPGPNALWHIDENHKLVLVVHGGIDGYSRLITFLRCSSNNLSETVLSCFLGAIQEYGIPSRETMEMKMCGFGSSWKKQGDKEGVLTLLEEVYTILVLRDCGEMCTDQCLRRMFVNMLVL